jgi:hypothetical protein
MRAASTLSAIGIAFCFATSSAHALGFGRVINATQLGQTLNFAAVVRIESDETLSRECVSAEVQSGENRLHPSQIRTTLESGADANERFIRVTTNVAMDEPVLTVSVTAGCGSKSTRRFVVFIDPPLVNLAAAGDNAVQTLPPQRADSQVSPIVGIVQGEEPAASAPRRAERAAAPRNRNRPAPVARTVPSGDEAGRAPALAAKPAAKPSMQRRLGAGSRATAAASGGPRLKLDPSPPMVAQTASAPISEALAALAAAEAASAASAAQAQAEQLARERARIQLLEEGLAKLRSESQATQRSLAALQTRLREAEAERYANPVVYALAWLAALLALAVAALLWRQSRIGRSAQWWAAPAPPAPAPAKPDARALLTPSVAGVFVSEPQPLDGPTTGAGAFDIPTVINDDDEPMIRPAAPPPPPVSLTPPHTAIEPARELSVEELIDLEQQAEFFIVLGQDEAAIELLMSHVRSDGGISPLPYLKLLEIYRRRGEREAYERIRDRFNRRFNAYAPDWEADLQQGRTLDDYPDSIERLQALWATPTRAMETLDASLFRRNKTDETFDLPAYRELLFLYSISRDLAEHGSTAPVGEVDLLLPLNDDPDAEPIARLSATTAPGELPTNEPMLTMPLDLDVSFGPGDNARESGSELSRPAPEAADSNFIDFDLDEPFVPPPKKPPEAG